MTSIGDDAFSGCSGLTSVTILGKTVSFGSYVFSNRPTIYCYQFSDADQWALDNGYERVYLNEDKYTNVLYLPVGILHIEAEAFAGLPMEAVIIPEGCQSIGRRAFAGCSKLAYVSIPAGLTDIAPDAFQGCDALNLE